MREHGRKSMLTPKQRTLAKKMTVVGRIEKDMPFTPFTPPTPENLAMMPLWGRADIPDEMGYTIPVPEGKGFQEYDKQEAELLANELEKLKGQPVIVTGGGGGGVQMWFLQDVKIVPWPEPLLVPQHSWDPQSRLVPKRKEGPRFAEDVWYEGDPSKPVTRYSVKVMLDNPFAKKDSLWMHDRPTFDPWVWSWRITALPGYGAEKIRKDWPAGWE